MDASDYYSHIVNLMSYADAYFKASAGERTVPACAAMARAAIQAYAHAMCLADYHHESTPAGQVAGEGWEKVARRWELSWERNCTVLAADERDSLRRGAYEDRAMRRFPSLEHGATIDGTAVPVDSVQPSLPLSATAAPAIGGASRAACSTGASGATRSPQRRERR